VRVLALVILLGGACAQLGPFTDGSSVSYGWTNNGALLDGARLPARGDGYEIPRVWSDRGLNWGTDELVGIIVRAARRVQLDAPGAPLYVGDMSPRRGGESQWHKSHQAGRDADLLFFLIDSTGKPVPAPDEMIELGADGATPATDGRGHKIPQLFLDIPREWALVRALLADPVADVQWLFISRPLKRLLLDYARSIHEPADVVERAASVLQQPNDAPPHDDHLHLRIFCPTSDRALGCKDREPLRWFKKTWKYLETARRVTPVELPAFARAELGRPFCQFLLSSSPAVASR
jgi:penicillin-insensitive murein endopeptidase